MTPKHIASLQQLTASERTLAEQFAFEHGRSYDSYLLLDQGREYFFGPDGCGVIGFARWRMTAYVLGGLLGPAACREELLASFLDFTAANGMEPLFFNALAEDLPLFRRQGFRVSKIGEEPLIDLQAATWSGRQFAWVRRQENACVREGVRCREVDVDPSCATYRAAVVPQIHEVSQQHLEATVYGRELALMVGQLDPLAMQRRRLFVAERENRIEAFVVATPAYAGDYWAIETWRRRPDASRGIITALFLHVARQLKSEGIRVLSLCQVPGLRSDQTAHAESSLVSHGLRIWWRRLGWFYDPVRLYHFKSRFRPAYRECFLVARQPRFLPMLAFALKWGVVWPDFRRLPRQMVQRMKKWSHTERLADPLAEGHQIVERLSMENATPLVLASTPASAETFPVGPPTGIRRSATRSRIRSIRT